MHREGTADEFQVVTYRYLRPIVWGFRTISER